MICVLLGVSEESKAYRLYDPNSKKIIVSRDVVFEEDKAWDWDQKCENAGGCDLEWGDEENDAAETDEREEVGEYEVNTYVENSASDVSIGDDLPCTNVERNRVQPAWMRDYETGEGLSEDENKAYLVMSATDDPVLFDEAIKSEKWRRAMDAEMEAIQKNDTWELIELPKGAKKIGVKWVYKTKFNEIGEVDKHKARLVVKGYSQQYGVDYTEVFAPVARMETIRMVVAFAAQRGWTIYQLDVKSAFLHGELSENVFVEQPSGYVQQGNEGKVYKLKNALYGLKQAPRAWYNRIDAYFSKEGFEKCDYEHTLFIKRQEDKVVIVSLYVDDLIVCGNDELLLIAFRNSMKNEFDMTDLGRMRYFLGLEVLQRSDGIFINQNKYASEVLKHFGMDNCNSIHNPIVPGFKPTKDEGGVAVDKTYYKQVIGSLMYLTATRPDMMFVVGLASRYMENPTQLHLQVVKRVLRYLKGTTEFGIFYKKGEGDELVAYTDSDYAADTKDRKSTSGYVFLLGSGAISWSSKKQPVVSLSTTEAEFITASSCACQAVWLRRVLSRLDQSHDKLTTIFCDSSSAIKLSKNPVMHDRSKHIDVRFHFLQELTKGGNVELVHCDSQDQVADVMTKPLKVDQFCKLRKLMGVCTEADIN